MVNYLPNKFIYEGKDQNINGHSRELTRATQL